MCRRDSQAALRHIYPTSLLFVSRGLSVVNTLPQRLQRRFCGSSTLGALQKLLPVVHAQVDDRLFQRLHETCDNNCRKSRRSG